MVVNILKQLNFLSLLAQDVPELPTNLENKVLPEPKAKLLGCYSSRCVKPLYFSQCVHRNSSVLNSYKYFFNWNHSSSNWHAESLRQFCLIYFLVSVDQCGPPELVMVIHVAGWSIQDLLSLNQFIKSIIILDSNSFFVKILGAAKIRIPYYKVLDKRHHTENAVF